MARSGRGVGSTTRVPLRGFAKIFSELPTSVRAILQRAFEEAENLMDWHSRSVPQKQERRRISGLVAVPVVTGINSIFGGAIRWDRSEDPRITMYEVQVDTVNVFPSPTTQVVLEPFFSLEGLTSSRFLRVRAIRFDGLTGNWSNTVQITPAQEEAPTVYTCGFYQGFDTDPDPHFTEPAKVFGGERIPRFYLLHECTFPVGRDAGGMSVFGYISNRLKKSRDGNVHPWDRIRFTVNDETITENYFCHWTTSSIVDSDTTGINPTTGDPLTFYGRGGYTAGFGPYTVLYPITTRAVGQLDPKIAQSDTGGSGVAWNHPKSIFRPSTWERSFSDGSLLTTADRMEEAKVTLPTGSSSQYLRAGDFGFQIPKEATIQGIQLKVKRRQANLASSNDFADLSTVVDSGALHHLYLDSRNITRADDIKSDGTFVYVQFDGVTPSDNNECLASGNLNGAGFPSGFSANSNRQISISTWVNLQATVADGVIFQSRVPSGTTWEVTLFESNGRLFFDVFDASATLRHRYDNFFTLNQWVHIAATFDGSIVGGGTTSEMFLYKNGVLQTPDNTTSSGDGAVLFGDHDEEKVMHIGGQALDAATTNRELDALIAQTGVWDEVIDTSEIIEIKNAGNDADLRSNFGDYQSAANLMHYWLIFPGPTDITDESVVLIDDAGDIRTDLSDRALPSESWPRLTTFTGGGIPHDSVEGIGYQEYGDENDLWGGSWTPDIVNSFYFGCAIKCKNNSKSFNGPAFIDHISAKVWYTGGFYTDEVNVKVFGESANQFYVEREVYGAVVNAIEVGGTV